MVVAARPGAMARGSGGGGAILRTAIGIDVSSTSMATGGLTRGSGAVDVSGEPTPDRPDGGSPDMTDRLPDGERVFVPLAHSDAVFRAVRDRLPAGYRLAFNHDGTTAWFRADANVDLQSIVDEVVRTK